MLVLSRKCNERVRIGNDIIITLVEIRGDQVRLGFDAPDSVSVHREQVYLQMQARGDVHSLAEDT